MGLCLPRSARTASLVAALLVWCPFGLLMVVVGSFTLSARSNDVHAASPRSRTATLTAHVCEEPAVGAGRCVGSFVSDDGRVQRGRVEIRIAPTLEPVEAPRPTPPTHQDPLPDARLHVIPDAGHWPQWEKVDEYLRAHRDFLLLGKDPA